jgi:alkylation response protein AidB-like acyl-CoA dehydrogenase
MARIAIPKGTKGLSFGPLYDTAPTISCHCRCTENVKVPAENIILPVGKGLSGALMAIDIARVSIASGCCGLMQSALDTALAYTANRKMFGGTALDLDGIQWMLGEVATDLEVSRLLYRAAGNALGTPEGPLMAAHAKRFVPDAAMKAANICTQAMGGMGSSSRARPAEPAGADAAHRRWNDGNLTRGDRALARGTRRETAEGSRPQGFWTGLKVEDFSVCALS